MSRRWGWLLEVSGISAESGSHQKEPNTHHSCWSASKKCLPRCMLPCLTWMRRVNTLHQQVNQQLTKTIEQDNCRPGIQSFRRQSLRADKMASGHKANRKWKPYCSSFSLFSSDCPSFSETSHLLGRRLTSLECSRSVEKQIQWNRGRLSLLPVSHEVRESFIISDIIHTRIHKELGRKRRPFSSSSLCDMSVISIQCNSKYT